MRSITLLFALLCAFASMASASITLSNNFQPFSGTGGDDDNCRALYNSRIDQCTDSVDFLNGKYCTSSCQQALQNMEAKLNNFCRGVGAERGSLLAAIFSKKLVESVCRDGGATEPQSSPRVTTTTKPVSTKTAQTTVTTGKSDDEDEATTTLKVTSSSSATVTISTSTFTTLETTPTTFIPLTTLSAQPAPTSTTISWREKARQDQACAILQGGGGSPFDNMISFRFPTDGKDRQARIMECEVIQAQRVRELKRKKSAASSSHKPYKPSSMVALVIGVGIGLMILG